MEDDGVYYPELRKIQKWLEQCWLHIKSYRCVSIYEDNCCAAVVLGYHIIVSNWKPVTFCCSYKKYINIAERNQHSKVELIIISFNMYDLLVDTRRSRVDVFSGYKPLRVDVFSGYQTFKGWRFLVLVMLVSVIKTSFYISVRCIGEAQKWKCRIIEILILRSWIVLWPKS